LESAFRLSSYTFRYNESSRPQASASQADDAGVIHSVQPPTSTSDPDASVNAALSGAAIADDHGSWLPYSNERDNGNPTAAAAATHDASSTTDMRFVQRMTTDDVPPNINPTERLDMDVYHTDFDGVDFSHSGPSGVSESAVTQIQEMLPFGQVDLQRSNDSRQENLEYACFIQHYAHHLASGLDLFASTQHSCVAAVHKFKHVDLVRFVLCAAAAKQMGHMKYTELVTNTTTAHSRLWATLNVERVDYLWYGAKYYGKAIQAMAADISSEAFMPHVVPPSLAQWADFPPVSQGTATSRVRAATEEARLLAACVMCQYEELSASRHAWAGHLNGLYRLLMLQEVETATSPSLVGASPTPSQSTTCQSFFWYFVHDDFQESFISLRPTRVDTSDRQLWQGFGLPFQEDGRLGSVQTILDPTLDPRMKEVIVLRMLTWLLCRTTNHIASRTRPNIALQSPVSSFDGPTNRPDRAPGKDWEAINHDLDLLHSAARSTALLDPDTSLPLTERDGEIISEIFVEEAWYISGTSAMAAMLLHAAKILLLSCMPSDILPGMSPVQGGAPDWISAYRALQKEMAAHAKAVFAIVIGTPQAVVKLHCLQPLYIAGRCLTHQRDQRKLIGLLVDLENKLGVASGYRVQDLLREWGNPFPQRQSDLERELSDISSAED
ncbi:hypothetical protein KCU83_g6330, partial [Aureobasidium melanogenum]